tara:strand:- start:194 stop:796 length:603 start_codon:yes stop_codon:yes gene_type:complete
MKSNRIVIQFSLISIGILLILATYFLYPKLKENKIAAQKTPVEEEKIDIGTDTKEETINTFENVEYKGLYDENNQFIVKSEKAYIFADNADMVHMSKMHLILFMNDGRVVNITSDKGRYNKTTYDTFFEGNVQATDGENEVFSENLDLLASEDVAHIYNNVVLKNDKSSLHADKIDYDFQTRYYHVSMYSEEKVKIKLVQ